MSYNDFFLHIQADDSQRTVEKRKNERRLWIRRMNLKSQLILHLSKHCLILLIIIVNCQALLMNKYIKFGIFTFFIFKLQDL